MSQLSGVFRIVLSVDSGNRVVGACTTINIFGVGSCYWDFIGLLEQTFVIGLSVWTVAIGLLE